MTSRTLFSNIRKEDRKHHLALNLLTTLYFLLVILAMAIQIQNEISTNGWKIVEIEQVIASYLKPNGFLIGGTIVIALVTAQRTFAYLHSRQQVDLYHALPVKRKMLFKALITNRFYFFALLQGVTLIIQMLFAVGLGCGSAGMIGDVVRTWICYLLIFEANFLLGTLAMLLTGNTIVGSLGILIFVGWIPVLIQQMISDLCSFFFRTYFADPEWLDYLQYGSPSFTSFCLAQGSDGTWHVEAAARAMIILCIWIFILLYVTKKLFEIRPSEAAGNAMAFPKWNPFLKIGIAVPCGIFIGNFFASLASENEKIWLLCGVLIGTILVSAVVEGIFELDPHALFHRKKEMAGIVVFALMIVATFALDIYGFDSYLPKAEKIESVMMESNLGSYYEESNMLMTGLTEEAVEKLRKGVTGEKKDEIIHILRDALSKKDETKDSEDDVAVYISYYLKNGTKKQRKYILNNTECDNVKTAFISSKEYKHAIFGIYHVKMSKIIGISVLSNHVLTESVLSKEKELKEFVKIYKKELESLTYEQMKHTMPVSLFYLDCQIGADSSLTYGTGYYIYPSFSESIAYLEKKGCVLNPTFSDAVIVKLVITKDGDTRKVIVDKKVLEQVKDKLYNQEVYPYEYALLGMANMDEYEITINANSGSNIGSEFSVVTDKETLQFLLSQ